MHRLLPLTMPLLLFAGCVNVPPDESPTGQEPTDAWSHVKNLLSQVPCEATYSGTQTTQNLLRLNLTTFDGPGGPQEIDVRGDLLLAARAGGFSAVDIQDPSRPVILGHYGDAGGMLDVKFTPDNQTALVTYTTGIDLVDVRNPDTLNRVGRWRFTDAPSPPAGLPGQNAHMIYTARIQQQDWAFLAPQTGTGAWILRIEGSPDERSLRYVTRTTSGGPAAPHDMYVQYDEDLKRWILYTADVTGWAAHDVTDPTRPTLLVTVPNNDPSGTHSVQAAKIGGRRIVATSTEFGANALKVWDATNLQAPILLAYWTRQVGPEVYEHQHNLNIVQGRLYMAHYAQGLFVFDLTKLATSPTGLLELRPVAHYAGSQRSNPGTAAQGGFWDLVLKDGILYAGSYTGGFEIGLHVIGYGCIPAGDPQFTSTG